jgi:hypothetical protein
MLVMRPVFVLDYCVLHLQACRLPGCSEFLLHTVVLQEDPVLVTQKMKHDPVMLVLLLIFFSNYGNTSGWSDFIRNPDLSELRGTLAVLPDIDRGLASGFPVKLQAARRIIGVCMHAAGFAGITGHSE